MSERTVTIYALEHGGRAYIGSALDPAKRLRQHVEGTGAKCTRRWLQEITPTLPDFNLLGEYPEGDRVPAEKAWIAEYVWQGWDMVNVILNVWPIGVGGLRRGAYKMNEVNKASGNEAQRRAGHTTTKIHKANGWKHQRQIASSGAYAIPKEAKLRGARKSVRRMNEIHRANGWEHQRRNGFKTSEINRANGWKQQRRAGRIRAHNRWHVNRGITNPECRLCREASQ